MPSPTKSPFRKSLEHSINMFSKENGSDTPDFILAEYLEDCLKAFDKAVTARTKWTSPAVSQGPTNAVPPQPQTVQKRERDGTESMQANADRERDRPRPERPQVTQTVAAVAPRQPAPPTQGAKPAGEE